mgnify:CR=1 FL=1
MLQPDAAEDSSSPSVRRAGGKVQATGTLTPSFFTMPLSIAQFKREHAVAGGDRYHLLALALVADRIRSNNTSQVLPPDFLPIGGIQRKEVPLVAASKHQLPGC